MTFAYSVTLTDPSDLGGANDSLLVTDLSAALSDWSNYISGLGTLVVNLVINNTGFGTAEGGPTSALADGIGPGGSVLGEPSSLYELLTGQHAPGDASDITITVDPDYLAELYLNPNPGNGAPVPANEVDAVSVFRHELEHGFGMAGYYDPTGTLKYGGAFVSLYDQYVQIEPNGLAYFTGAAAEAVYGGPVPLTTDNSGENYYHLAESGNGPLGQDLMNGQAFNFGTTYDISNLDIAILQDIGVPISGGLTGSLPCFAAGTRIATERGQVAVENLREGDRAVVLNSPPAQKIKWIGHRHIDCRRHPDHQRVLPVRVAAHAFQPNQPSRDLRLSPDHAVFVDGVLIPIRQLINGTTIAQMPVDDVTYYHVELDRHDVLLAEGLPAESYLDTGNRATFSNSGGTVSLHPSFDTPKTWRDDAIAPLAGDEVRVKPVWERLAERARLLGQPVPAARFTEDPALRLIVDGNVIQPVVADHNRCVFALPKRTATLHLVSRAGYATDSRPWIDDERKLGAYVSRIIWYDLEGPHDLPMDHPSLDEGWWAIERDGDLSRRWTDGNALLPCATGAFMIEIQLAGEMSYKVEPDTQPDQAGTELSARAA